MDDFQSMRRRLSLALFSLCLIALSAGCQRSGDGITVAGSTSVEPFAELLAEEYMHEHPGTHIYVQGGGSTAGIEAVKTHTANIGMSSRALVDGEKNLHAITVAKDAIVIIVHRSNPIDDLSLIEIRRVFSGNVRRWKELGGAAASITLVTREEGSGTREAFQKFVMGKDEISLGSLVQDSNGAVRQVVASNPSAIGYLSLGLVNDQVKALRVAGVEPNLRETQNGTYTLVRPFLFVFNQEPEGMARSFVQFVLSSRPQQLLQKEGLVPVFSELDKE